MVPSLPLLSCESSVFVKKKTHHLVESAPTKAITVAEDTGIFVLLLHFTFFKSDVSMHFKSEAYMQPTDKELLTHAMDIAAACQSHLRSQWISLQHIWI